MKKIISSIFVFMIAIMSICFVGCSKTKEEVFKDGYYILSLSKSSVEVDGTTRNLSEYLEWMDMTLAEYEDDLLGTISIQIEGNNMVVFSDGAILANGTFTMDGDTMLCSSGIAEILSYASVQNLKWKNGEISCTLIYGKYTHKPVYVKTEK